MLNNKKSCTKSLVLMGGNPAENLDFWVTSHFNFPISRSNNKNKKYFKNFCRTLGYFRFLRDKNRFFYTGNWIFPAQFQIWSTPLASLPLVPLSTHHIRNNRRKYFFYPNPHRFVSHISLIIGASKSVPDEAE